MLSILTILSMITFFVYKLESLLTFTDYKIQRHDQDYYFDMTDKFGFEKNDFYFSGGVTDYDGTSHDITDLQIG